MTTQTETPELFDPLTALDRCDNGGCNAAALVRVAKSKASLVFCGHHYTSNVVSLAFDNWDITEDRRDG